MHLESTVVTADVTVDVDFVMFVLCLHVPRGLRPTPETLVNTRWARCTELHDENK